MPYKQTTHNRRTKKIVMLAGIVATAIALVAAGIWVFFAYQQDQAEKEAAALEALPRVVIPEGHFALAAYEKPEVSKSVKSLTIRPGVDVYKKADADQAALEKEVDTILAELKELEFNAILLDTVRMQDGVGSVIFPSDKLQSTPVDFVSILLQKAQALGIPVSLKLNLTGVTLSDGAAVESLLSPQNKRALTAAAVSLASKYEFDNLLFDSYYSKKDGSAYKEYVAGGMQGEYDEWLLQNAKAGFDEIISAVKTAKPTLPIGLCLDSVWANQNPDNEKAAAGSPTQAEFEALFDGHVDTKAMIESGRFDFVNVAIPTAIPNEKESFQAIVNYWGGVCKTAAVPMYVTHSGENAVSKELAGWNGTDELSRQVELAVKSGNYYGSSFTGVERLVANPEGSTEYLLKYLRDEINVDEMFSDLEITSPTKKSYTTYEEEVQFRMKFDPNADVKLNGEKVEPSSRGGASVWVPLKVGKNTIVLEHKGKSLTYSIERKVVIFQSVDPTKEITVAGGSTIYVSAMAYKGSKITATLNGKTITLEEGGGSESDVESAYVNYQGSFTAIKATNKVQSMGSISFNGTYQGYPESAKGGAVTVDKLADDTAPDALTGQTVNQAVVTGKYANVYPYQSPTTYAAAILYQLPQGTQDIVVNQSGDYVNLRSGKTVHKNSVSISPLVFDGNNAITQLSTGVEGNDTVVRMTMNWRSPFSLTPSPYATQEISGKSTYQFTANTITLTMDYVTMVATEGVSGSFADSPIFSGISYEKVFNETTKTNQMKITLPMRQAGRYYGAYADWEDNTLVLRFNHGASAGSLSGVRIVVDPGHGGSDTGNMAGRDVIEKHANLDQATRVRDALTALGAEVIMTRETDATMSLDQRVAFTESQRADLFLSIHYNSAGSDKRPGGVQVYYNSPFSQPLAKSVQTQLDTVLPNTGWNAVWGKNFLVTRERQYPSVLVECGFLSNPTDEARTFDTAYLDSFAAALARGVSDYYAMYN